jgi:hypothetical protein
MHEAHHGKAWGLISKTPVLDAHFDHGYSKCYTMIGAVII